MYWTKPLKIATYCVYCHSLDGATFFFKVNSNVLPGYVKSGIALICAKFGADLINTNKFKSRQTKSPVFWPTPCNSEPFSIPVISHRVAIKRNLYTRRKLRKCSGGVQSVSTQSEKNFTDLHYPTHIYDTIRYDRWFALENWQASCQFNLAHELKEN